MCKSLVEKVTVIANQTSIPLISTEYLTYTSAKPIIPGKEELLNLLSVKRDEITDSTIQQSLDLLMNDLLNPQLPEAIIQGLLKNLQANSHSKWTAYLYKTYLETQ